MAPLDTTVLIDLTRREGSPNRTRAVSLLRQLEAAGDTLVTTILNEAEFRVGQFRSKNQSIEARKIEDVLSAIFVLDFDVACARRFAEPQAKLLDKGRPAGEIDALIAAVALQYGQQLVTRNPAHFAEMDGLTILTY